MITMTEIARLTHVSQPTVSRVLNGNKAVDPEIRERVLACAREHDYQLNALAKGLQGSRTQLLGLMLTDISNSFFADLAKEVEGQARRHGYSIILFNCDHDPQRQREYMDVVRRYRVDGMVIAPVLRDMKMWQECVSKLDVPAVVVTRRVEGLDCVYLDHEAAGRKVARYLMERGYERFLFIGRERDWKYQGFSRELAEAGADADGRLSFFESEDDEELRTRLTEWYSQGKGRPGIFANNDIWALRILHVLRQLRLSVPEEVGVIGFDDTYMGRYLHPRLSSVSQPIARMAEAAVSRLMYRLDHPAGKDILKMPLEAALVLRESI